MKTIYLRRFDMDLNNCLGVWRMEELKYPLFTLELPWRYNAILASCIPEGIYTILPYESSRFGSCFKIDDVVGRTNIRLHVGNTYQNTEGCILIGKRCGNFQDGEEAIFSSREAMDLLLDIIKEPRELHITNCWI